MKRKLLIAAGFLLTQLCAAQVLYHETFDNLNVGNLGADLTGITSGQGGWYLHYWASPSYPNTVSVNNYQIENYLNKGKVLVVKGLDGGGHGGVWVTQTQLDAKWNTRTVGNNVLVMEYDFYTGDETLDNTKDSYCDVVLFSTQDKIMARVHYNPFTERTSIGDMVLGTSIISQLPKKQWVKIIHQVDYNAGKIYTEIPSMGVIASNAIPLNLNGCIPSEILVGVGHPSGSLFQSISKFDNFKVTATNQVNLSLATILNEKFNLYPNPASNVVTITNGENLLVQQIAVYDTTGKLIKTENYNNKTEIQLNVENLASGTYLLHLKTNEGTAVKKLVKK